MLFISSDSYLENVWSDPIYALVQNSGSEIATIYGVYFPYKHIYLNLTPALAMVISLTLSVLYSFVMSVFFFCINLKLSHVLSYVTVMMIHVVGYILLSLFYSYGYIKFSLFGNSLLMYHNINDYFDKGLFHTFFQSCLIYIIIAAVLIFLIIKAIQTYDFNNSGGIRP